KLPYVVMHLAGDAPIMEKTVRDAALMLLLRINRWKNRSRPHPTIQYEQRLIQQGCQLGCTDPGSFRGWLKFIDYRDSEFPS
ncbi:13145_t:CDS:1, partial [Acaulospora morrowiae]